MVPQIAWVLDSFWTSYFQICFKSILRCWHLSSWSKSYSSPHTITVSIPNSGFLSCSHKIWLTLQISTRWLLSFPLLIAVYYEFDSFFVTWDGPCTQDPYDYWVDFLLLVVIQKKNQEKSPQRSRPLAKVRAIISLRSFYFAGFNQISTPLNLKAPGGDIPWSFKSSKWPSSNQEIKEQFNVYDVQRRSN